MFAALGADGDPGEPEDAGDGDASPDDPLVSAAQRAAHGLARPVRFDLIPRDYQREALAAWARHDGRGVVVLPTGAGKTVVALMAVARLGLRTLVVAPTIELLGQWRGALAERLGYPLSEVGIVGGGKRTVRDLTVITYDSAAMPTRRLDGFGLLVVDEAHHLPARAYQTIAAKVNAPFRLGLSATPERSDGGHHQLDRLIGPTVYRRSAAELARDNHIADYAEKRLFVDLTPEEQFRYEQLMAEYRWYIAAHRNALGRPQTMFAELIRRSAHDPAARSALRAHHQARMIALNAEAKIDRVVELLDQHRDDKAIVFSEYNVMVDALSERLLLPAITYRTALPERRQVLERFRDGSYSKLVTGRVLNEGVDVPDANVAIVVSGSSATREYIQRLGRVLRPKREKALLYELVTRRTTEGRSARKRRPSEPIDPDRRQRRLDEAARASD
ncbi:MAG: DEAD/DEAH box helicase [Thermomicrobiales bacterium]|nr:DEAD/DEAH box helicase [Thermomicrobiales bacterium]